MYQIIPKEKRVFSDMWEMNSYFLFSFAHYRDPNNESFWNIRVFNDDFLWPKSGFPFHPHQYYEIMTIVLEWTISHKDSLGNQEKIGKNEVQITDTASGILHSEFNETSENLKLYQIWFSPEIPSPTPKYSTFWYTKQDLKNTLLTLASWLEEHSHTLTSKISVKRGIFDEGETLEIDSPNKIFLYVTSGEISLNGDGTLPEKYQLRSQWEKLHIRFTKQTDFILIEST